MEKKTGRIINMRLFSLSKPSLTLQEPLADHTSGATWNMKTGPACMACMQRQCRMYYMAHRLPEKGCINIEKPASITEQFLKNLNSPGVFYSPFPLGAPQLWGDARNGCGANQLFGTTTAPAYVPPQQFSYCVICRLCARHCSKKQFYSTVFVIDRLLPSLGISLLMYLLCHSSVCWLWKLKKPGMSKRQQLYLVHIVLMSTCPAVSESMDTQLTS